MAATADRPARRADVGATDAAPLASFARAARLSVAPPVDTGQSQAHASTLGISGWDIDRTHCLLKDGDLLGGVVAAAVASQHNQP
jgi:hypothetical protein